MNTFKIIALILLFFNCTAHENEFPITSQVISPKEQKEFLKQLKESKQSGVKSGFRSRSFKESILRGPEEDTQAGDYNRIIKGEK